MLASKWTYLAKTTPDIDILLEPLEDQLLASSPGPARKNGKGPSSVSVYFLSTITFQNFEEPIRLQNETTRNVIPSHAHKAKSADYAIW